MTPLRLIHRSDYLKDTALVYNFKVFLASLLQATCVDLTRARHFFLRTVVLLSSLVLLSHAVSGFRFPVWDHGSGSCSHCRQTTVALSCSYCS